MVSFKARPFVCSLVCAAAFTGCANGSSGVPTQQSIVAPMVAGPAAHLYGNDLMYSSRPSGNQIAVYKRKHKGLTLKPYQNLTSGVAAPMGMAATPGGRLYVANSGDSNVLVYRTTRKGAVGPVATLADDGEVPVNVGVTPNQRIVAVSNGSSTGSGAGSVSVYVNRKDRPSRTLTFGNDALQGEGIAIDSNGNCYWSFNDPSTLTGAIVEFTSCKGIGSPIVSGLSKAGGLAFDRSGNLYYVDQLAGIYKCAGLSHCALLIGIECTDCLIRPANINFDNSTPQNLWVADAAGSIEAVSLSGVIEYQLNVAGGPSDPPIGIAPAPGS